VEPVGVVAGGDQQPISYSRWRRMAMPMLMGSSGRTTMNSVMYTGGGSRSWAMNGTGRSAAA